MIQAIRRIFSRANPLESPSFSLNDPAAFDVLGGDPVPAGVPVTEQIAMKLPAFWQCVNTIAPDVSKIPLDLWTYTDEQDPDRQHRTRDRTNPAFRLVRWQANEEQTAYDFWETMLAHALVWRNAFAFIDRDRNERPLGLYPLRPDETSRVTMDGVRYYKTAIDGKTHYFHPWDIFHLRGISFNNDMGLQLVKFAREALGKIIAAGNLQSSFFKHGGRVGGVLQLPAAQSKTNRDKIEEGFKKTYEGADKAFKTVILREGAKFMEAQRSFTDTQMTTVNDQDVATVGRLFSIPPHKLGLKSNASYRGLEQENRAYEDSCLSPWFHRIASQCWLKLLNRPERIGLGHWFEHNTGALLWADSKTLSGIATNGVRGGWLRPNEARKWFNLPPDSDGGNLLIPSGMVRADGTAIDGEQNRALEQLITTTRDRLVKRLAIHARKAAKNGALESWLASDMRRDHESIAQEMFSPVQALKRAFDGSTEDLAIQAMDQFAQRMADILETGTDPAEFLETLTQ